MSSAAKRRKRKKKSQAPVALVYVVTVLIFMALISMLSIYLLRMFHIIGVEEEEEAVVTVQSFNDLFARVNSKGVLSDMSLVRIDPTDNKVIVVPLSAMTLNSADNATMRDIYSRSGMVGVKEAVEGTLGLTVDNYATLTNESFERICDIYGGITYKAPEELYYLSQENDENDISIQKGELATLGGRQIRLLSQYPVFTNGKQGNNEFLGEAMESLISSMFQQAYITQDNLDNLYGIITSNSDTDMNTDDFKLQKSYIKEMLSSGLTTTERMIPEGIWGENDESFVINREFIDTLRERAAETTPEDGGVAVGELASEGGGAAPANNAVPADDTARADNDAAQEEDGAVAAVPAE